MNLNNISGAQREFLFLHVDGVYPVRRCIRAGITKNEDATRASLITLGLIAYDVSESIVGRPKGTRLTEKGREVVCYVLGQYADALVRTGYMQRRPHISWPPPHPQSLNRPTEVARPSQHVRSSASSGRAGASEDNQ